MSQALLTDLYELTMAYSYFKRGMNSPATFDLFVRPRFPTVVFWSFPGWSQLSPIWKIFILTMMTWPTSTPSGSLTGNFSTT